MYPTLKLCFSNRSHLNSYTAAHVRNRFGSIAELDLKYVVYQLSMTKHSFTHKFIRKQNIYDVEFRFEFST